MSHANREFDSLVLPPTQQKPETQIRTDRVGGTHPHRAKRVQQGGGRVVREEEQAVSFRQEPCANSSKNRFNSTEGR